MQRREFLTSEINRLKRDKDIYARPLTQMAQMVRERRENRGGYFNTDLEARV